MHALPIDDGGVVVNLDEFGATQQLPSSEESLANVLETEDEDVKEFNRLVLFIPTALVTFSINFN